MKYSRRVYRVQGEGDVPAKGGEAGGDLPKAESCFLARAGHRPLRYSLWMLQRANKVVETRSRDLGGDALCKSADTAAAGDAGEGRGNAAGGSF